MTTHQPTAAQLLPTPALPKIVRANENGCLHLPGEERRPLLESSDTGGTLTLSLSQLEEGRGTLPHVGTREDEVFFVQSGEFGFRIGGRTEVLRAGDFAFVPRGTPHSHTCCTASGLLWSASTKPPRGKGTSSVSPQIARPQDGECIETRGESVRLVLSSEASGGSICVAQSQTPPLGAARQRAHEGFDVAFLILAGRYEFGLDDARVQSKMGDIVWIPCGTPYSFRVVSPDPGRALVISTPGGLDDFLRRHELPQG